MCLSGRETRNRDLTTLRYTVSLADLYAVADLYGQSHLHTAAIADADQHLAAPIYCHPDCCPIPPADAHQHGDDDTVTYHNTHGNTQIAHCNPAASPAYRSDGIHL